MLSPTDRDRENAPPRKELAELCDDLAFREFFKLQEGFEWNVAMRLVQCLDRLLGKSHDDQNDLLIIQTLDLVQGVLLVHPPSRSLFSREIYMNVGSYSSYFIYPTSCLLPSTYLPTQFHSALHVCLLTGPSISTSSTSSNQ